MISARHITLEKNGRQLVSDASIQLKINECVGLIGPNGAGKTTLMRSLMNFEPKAKGHCNLWGLTAKERVYQVAWLAQDRQVAWDMSVRDLVMLGRSHRKSWSRFSEEDETYVKRAINILELQNYQSRSFHSLSGGEQARVLIARVLAQNTPFILADEPIDALDPAQQIRVLSLFKKLTEFDQGILFSIHDLGMAARYCTRLILMDKGHIIADGSVDDVLCEENLEHVFGIRTYRAEHDGPILQPIDVVEE